jgi:2-polyprenyl-6-methoxyphenol hydroxylase-like FAD-dependent oxidoreductase
VVLGRCLRADGDVARALRRYEELRQSRTQAITTQSRRIGSVAQWSHPLACRLRNLLLTLTPPQLQVRGIVPILAYDAARVAV